MNTIELFIRFKHCHPTIVQLHFFERLKPFFRERERERERTIHSSIEVVLFPCAHDVESHKYKCVMCLCIECVPSKCQRCPKESSSDLY
ncbi:hypothetical protein KP509_31G017700 [Ceratopteris richardii]|uniref:Uncharacterized protein n=1 Tax=Ceratopteris richardii TaxID=49495 RepID=A0A8T2QY14_CERRI|nr:hypothetical protein KP509_31G017700 [Ceratopteris richardii]